MTTKLIVLVSILSLTVAGAASAQRVTTVPVPVAPAVPAVPPVPFFDLHQIDLPHLEFPHFEFPHSKSPAAHSALDRIRDGVPWPQGRVAAAIPRSYNNRAVSWSLRWSLSTRRPANGSTAISTTAPSSRS